MMNTIDSALDTAEGIVALAVAAHRFDTTAGDVGPCHWTPDELLAWWRDRNYRDPVGRPSIDWRDPVDCVAVTMHAWTWHTPESVRSLLDHQSSRGALDDIWRALTPQTRQLLRRRACLALGVANAAPS
jgi:hypothetical protein